MRNQPDKPDSSPFNASKSKGSAKNKTEFSPEMLEDEFQNALESGEGERVLELLDSVPARFKNNPEFLMLRATMLATTGREREAIKMLQDLERKNPRFAEVCAPLAELYREREWTAHALQAAQRALSSRDVLDEVRESMKEIIQETTEELQTRASKFAVSMEIMRQAATFHEKALIAMDDEKLMDADFLSQKASKLVPAWNPPYNNRAQALFFTGRPGEAINVLESVLARDAENVFALRLLVTYHYGLEQMEQARGYASRLEALIPKLPVDSIEVDQVVIALALLEDTPALWKIAKKYLDQPAEFLYSSTWRCLAVAAVRSGKWKNALDLMDKADEDEELTSEEEKFIDKLRVARRLRPPRLAWMPPEYPVANLLLNSKIITDLVNLLKDLPGPLPPSQQRKLENYLQKYTFVKTAMKSLLRSELSFRLALEVLANLNQTDADAEILRFALGQDGSQDGRMQAIMALVQSGRYSGPKVIKLWNEELGEWREVALSTQRIGDIPARAQPKTLVLIEKANRARKPDEAIALLRKAVEIEPTSGMAIFNLGVTLAKNGNMEEGEALIYQSVTVDPDYTFGHANIALKESKQGNEKAALDHLEFVTRAELIATDTAVIANLAWSSLALEKRDLKLARKHFDLAAQLNPEHHLVEEFESGLERAEKYSFILDFQRESAIRAHQKLLKTELTQGMNLRNCLEINTRDMLGASAKFLHISISGQKAELAAWLAKKLLDPEFLQETLADVLEGKEREALGWLMEAGGARPWNEFTRKYGDDMYESTFWTYHVPESIPGRLRMAGLFYSGTLEGLQVAFIPPDVRALLRELLK